MLLCIICIKKLKSDKYISAYGELLHFKLYLKFKIDEQFFNFNY